MISPFHHHSYFEIAKYAKYETANQGDGQLRQQQRDGADAGKPQEFPGTQDRLPICQGDDNWPEQVMADLYELIEVQANRSNVKCQRNRTNEHIAPDESMAARPPETDYKDNPQGVQHRTAPHDPMPDHLEETVGMGERELSVPNVIE
jgi:hypothetical protein